VPTLPTYVPLLRIAAAEMTATASAEGFGLSDYRPLFVPIPKNYTEERKPDEKFPKARAATGADVSVRIASAANALGTWYANAVENNESVSAFVDVDIMDRQYGANLLEEMFGHLEDRFPRAIPVVHLRRAEQRTSVQRISAKFGTGHALRMEAIGKPDLLEIDRTLAACAAVPESTDLIYDLKFVGEAEYASQAPILAKKVELLLARHWRSVTLLGGSMEQKPLGGYGERELARYEWLLWKRVASALHAKDLAAPIFGDYGVLHPNYQLSSGIPHPYLRYTADEKFWFFRASPKGVDGREGAYRRVCRACIAKPDYDGPAFSSGDFRIDDVANNNGKVSNPQRWVWTMTDHHLVHVAAQLRREGA
jgi:hypothetical protein